MARARTSNFAWLAGLLGAGALNLLSLAGLADSLVEWRCFLRLEEVLATYQALKAFLFSLLPFEVPSWLKDYAVITASFSVMMNLYGHFAEKKSVPRILAETEGIEGLVFRVILYTMPWVVLLWFGYRHLLWRLHFGRLKRLFEDDADSQRQLLSQERNEQQKAKILSRTVIGYPVACVALLFVFSDFAYTLTGQTEIAGVSFRRECAARGEIIRLAP